MPKISLPRDYDIKRLAHNPADPDPWQSLWLDNSVPVHAGVKQAWLFDSNTWSRQFMLPILRPIARCLIVLLQIVKIIIPNWLSSSRILHKFLAWALARFASPEANWLILRHFWIGSENLAFLNANIEAGGVEMHPLKPKDVPDLVDNLFIQHDINLFNFISRINLAIQAHGKTEIKPKANLDFSMISDYGDFAIAPQNNGLFNVFDLQTCIDLFTPIYQLFLTDKDFWRSVHSLQFDETIGIYAAKVLKKPEGLILVNNKHPMIIPATWSAGYRLVLHGLSAEMLHAILVQAKHNQVNQ